jgi:hypothetical protein
MLLIAILIGLNITGCDPKESFYLHSYQIVFQNDTDKEIKLIHHRLGSNGTDAGNTIIKDTLIVSANSKKTSDYLRNPSDSAENGNFDIIIKESIDVFFNEIGEHGKLELYIGNDIIKTWKGAANYLGNVVNTPYNYDSWKVIKYDELINPSYDEFIYGEIIFTITNKDLE